MKPANPLVFRGKTTQRSGLGFSESQAAAFAGPPFSIEMRNGRNGRPIFSQ